MVGWTRTNITSRWERKKRVRASVYWRWLVTPTASTTGLLFLSTFLPLIPSQTDSLPSVPTNPIVIFKVSKFFIYIQFSPIYSLLGPYTPPITHFSKFSRLSLEQTSKRFILFPFLFIFVLLAMLLGQWKRTISTMHDCFYGYRLLLGFGPRLIYSYIYVQQ